MKLPTYQYEPGQDMKQLLLKMMFAVAGIMAAGFAMAQPVKLLRGPDFDIALDAPRVSLRIPVSIASTDSFVVRLIDVSFNEKAYIVPQQLFNAGIQTDSFKNSFLVINIENTASIRQGRYGFLFNIFNKGKATDPLPLMIYITARPAQLWLAPTPVVARIQNGPFMDFSLENPCLPLFEISGNSSAGPVTIRQLSLRDATGKPITSLVTFDSGWTVQNGRSAIIPLTINGQLPLGTVSGTFEINAPQLAAPVQFNMNFVSKRSGWWIIWLIIAGLFLGMFTRVFLTGLLDTKNARLRLLEAMSGIDKLLATHPDISFTKELQKAKEELLKGKRSSKASDIIQHIEDGKKIADAALLDVADRDKTLRENARTFGEAISGDWFLGGSIKTLLSVAASELQMVYMLANANDPGKAAEAFNTLKNKLAHGLKEQLIELKQTFLATYESVKNSPLKIVLPTASIASQLNTLVDSVAAIAENGLADTANLRSVLGSLDDQRRRTLNLFFSLSLSANSMLESVHNVFIAGKVPMDDVVAGISSEINTAFVTKTDEGLDRIMSGSAASMRAIQARIVKEFTGMPGLTGEERIAIDSDLSAGNYKEAAQKIVSFQKPGRTNPETGFAGKGSVSFPQIATAISGFLVDVPRPPDASAGITGLSEEHEYLKLSNAITWITLVQQLFIAAAVCVIGYSLFSEKFTGTASDMAEIFFWAFAINISLLSLTVVTELVTKKSKQAN